MNDETSTSTMLSAPHLERMEAAVQGRIASRTKVRRRRHRVIASGLAVLLVAGGTTAGALIAWPTNQQGQTYGPADGRVHDPATGEVIEPELVEAVGWNGDERVAGYVRSDDLVPEFSSPEEVAAWLEEHPPTEDREIPLYNRDGEVIGVFIVQGIDPGTEGISGIEGD